jgi:hypothetical protein
MAIGTDEATLTNFKTELAALLKKYDATLGVDVDGDTHGLMYDFTVEINRKDYMLRAGYSCLEASDLEDKGV